MVFLRSQLNNQSDLRSLHSTWFKHQHPSAQHLASLYMFYPRNRQFLLGLVTCFFFFFFFFLSFFSHFQSSSWPKAHEKLTDFWTTTFCITPSSWVCWHKFQPLFQPRNPTLPPQFSNTASPAWVPSLHPRSQNFPRTESEGECRAPFFPLNCGSQAYTACCPTFKNSFLIYFIQFYGCLWWQVLLHGLKQIASLP